MAGSVNSPRAPRIESSVQVRRGRGSPERSHVASHGPPAPPRGRRRPKAETRAACEAGEASRRQRSPAGGPGALTRGFQAVAGCPCREDGDLRMVRQSIVRDASRNLLLGLSITHCSRRVMNGPRPLAAWQQDVGRKRRTNAQW